MHQRARIGQLLIGTVALLVLPGVSFAVDAVDTLRDALKIQVSSFKPDLVQLATRTKMIEDSIKEMKRTKSIAQFRRAYFLKEWSQHFDQGNLKVPSVQPYRKEIGDLLEVAMRSTAKGSDADRRIALGVLIAEIADADEPPLLTNISAKPDLNKIHEKFARRLTDVLVSMARGRDEPPEASLPIRQVALSALGKITPDPVVAFPVLLETLRKEDLGPRRLAAYALVDLARNSRFLARQERRDLARTERLETIRQVIGAVAVALKDKDELVRGYALQASAESARAFLDFVSSSEEQLTFDDKAKKKETVAADVEAILKAYRAANAQVIDALSADQINLRLAAVRALDQIGQARFKLMQNLVPEKREKRGGAFKQFEATDPFEDILKSDWAKIAALLDSPDVRLRRSAIEFFEVLGDQAEVAVDKIAEALRDKDRLVRWTAARTLRSIDPKKVGPAAVNALCHMLIDPDPDLSAAAAATIEKLGVVADDAVDFLAFIIGNGDPNNRNWDVETRIAALKALVGIGNPPAQRAFPKVVDVLADPDVRLRREAAFTIGRLGPPSDAQLVERMREALRAALRDEDAQVRTNASEAILSLPTK